MGRYRKVFPIVAAALGAMTANLLSQTAPPTAAPATAPATYIGITTTRGYTPFPTTTQVGATTRVTTYPTEYVVNITDQARRDYRINAFYSRVLFHKGFPIIGSPRVSDWAYLEAANLLDHMFKFSPPEVWQTLLRNRVKLGIISVVEYTMDMPDSNNGGRNPAMAIMIQQDLRSRGLGGANLATCAEENLLNLRGDPYTSEDITLHEFSHTVASNMPREFQQRLSDAYDKAMQSGLIDKTIYAGTNWQEYWAEGAQAWFDCARVNDRSVNSGIATRDQLKQRDPARAALEKEIYGDGDWRYVKTPAGTVVNADGKQYQRTPEELAHLEGFDAFRNLYPVFSFNDSPRIEANDNAPADQARIEGLQAALQADPAKWAGMEPAIEKILTIQDQIAAVEQGGSGGAPAGRRAGPAAPVLALPVVTNNPLMIAAFNINQAINDPAIPADKLEAAVTARHATYTLEKNKMLAEIQTQRAIIKPLLTARQEAILVSLGILE